MNTYKFQLFEFDKGKVDTNTFIKIIVSNMGSYDGDRLQMVIDAMKNEKFEGIVVLGGTKDGTSHLAAYVSSTCLEKVHAGELIKYIAPIIGGKGGGKADNARGGGKECSNLEAALLASVTFIAKSMLEKRHTI